jgi:hypothetical protein
MLQLVLTSTDVGVGQRSRNHRLSSSLGVVSAHSVRIPRTQQLARDCCQSINPEAFPVNSDQP